jgi:UDP-N-acetylmuramoyl-tripeptide--D-alanyl-D-alanine ligase
MIDEIYDAFIDCNQQITTDTRKINKNDLFFALRGPTFNGNSFTHKALKKGAKYAVIDDENYFIEGKTFLVDDVLNSLQKLALIHRRKINIPVIAITGTNGKTTTKELIGSVLNTKFNVLITKGNLNNHIGVPLTILKIQNQHQIAVIEMGASKKGDIKELVEIALPNYGIITNIGKAHLAGFGNIETIQKTKLELYDYIIKSKGEIILNKDDSLLFDYLPSTLTKHTYGHNLSDLVGKLINQDPFLEIEIKSKKNKEIINTHLLGSYNLNNVLAAVSFGQIFGLGLKNISNAISKYKPNNNRSQLIKTKNNIIIADCYNANPTSTLEALKSFKNLKNENKLVILGDMLELGEVEDEEHQFIVNYLKNNNIKSFLVGKYYQKTVSNFKCFESTEQIIDFIKSENYTDYIVLLKGSRGIQLESIINENIL